MPQQGESWLGTLGHWIEPLFAPLGLDWRYGVAIFTSFAVDDDTYRPPLIRRSHCHIAQLHAYSSYEYHTVEWLPQLERVARPPNHVLLVEY